MRALLTALGLTLFLSFAVIAAVFTVLSVATRPASDGPGSLLARDVSLKPLEEALAESATLRRLMRAQARREAGAVQLAFAEPETETSLSPQAAKASAVAAIEAARAAARRGEEAAHAVYAPWPQESARGVAHLRLAATRSLESAAEPLDLGPNVDFERALREASRRSGLSPATLAALIDAEAYKRPDGGWDAASANPASTARGLAQFLAGSWLHEAAEKDRYLHRVAKARGLIAPNGAVLDRKGLLALRLDPRLSLITAAELAADNLVSLARSGYAPKDDAAAARLAYLAHHEGLAGARAHLAGAVEAGAAAQRLRANIGEKRYASLLKAHDGEAEAAYTSWLETYIDRRIQPQRFVRVVN